MITHIDPSEVPAIDEVLGHPLISTAIVARARCVQPQMDFWRCEDSEDATIGYLCRNGATHYLTGEQRCADEVADLLRGTGYDRVMTDLVLPLGTPSKMQAVDWLRDCPATPQGASFIYLTSTDGTLSVVDFARLQLTSGALGSEDEAASYAVSLSHSVRHGCAAAVALVEDGCIVAGAAVNHVADGRAILGAVAVLPTHRRRGLATLAVTAGVALAHELGVVPYLCCRDELLPLYTGTGFTPIAPLSLYRKETN